MLYSKELSSNLSDELLQIDPQILKIDPQMMKIYQKPYKLLTTQEKELCYQTFKNLSFFHKLLIENEYGELMFRTIIKRMSIKILEPGIPIFKIREPISSMIFVLEGRIIVYKALIQSPLNINNDEHKINYNDQYIHLIPKKMSFFIFNKY